MPRFLEQALVELQEWQNARTLAQRRGMCLAATRYAVTEAGMRLPAPQPAPDNTALWNGKTLAASPANWGWIRITPQSSAFGGLRLDYFDTVGVLPDGRVAGHIGITNPDTGVIFSAVNFDWNDNWSRVRIASFIPMPLARGFNPRTFSRFSDPTINPATVPYVLREEDTRTPPPVGTPDFDAFVRSVNDELLSNLQILDAEQ